MKTIYEKNGKIDEEIDSFVIEAGKEFPIIRTEKEMNDILNKYNNYEPIFKLQMKIWTKLLSNDKCKELNNCSDIERRK